MTEETVTETLTETAAADLQSAPESARVAVPHPAPRRALRNTKR